MARRSPVQIRLDKLRKKAGLRKSQALTFESEKSASHDITRKGVIIPDIDYGAWSFIDQEFAPDYPGRKFDFI